MIRLQISPSSVSPADLQSAVDALRAGGVVAYPTETFYGLAVDPRAPDAVEKIFRLKQRPPDHAIPLIAADHEQVLDHVGVMNPTAERLAERGWPGALTLIITASRKLAPETHLHTGRIAVRVPENPVARMLALAAGHAITSTSANISGQPPASTAESVASALGDQIDVLIDAGPTNGGLPSTIVDTTGTRPMLVRKGSVPWERVLEFLH
jgi:L-threonylcarbamoyladenylate synthase